MKNSIAIAKVIKPAMKPDIKYICITTLSRLLYIKWIDINEFNIKSFM